MLVLFDNGTPRTLARYLKGRNSFPCPNEVVEIDAKSATVARRWSTLQCKQPVSMALDTTHHRLFSGCRSGVMAVSDYQAGKLVTTLPIGAGVDGAGYDAASGHAFASNADGTLTVIHQDTPDTYHVVQNVQTPQSARNMGLDPTNHRVFIVSAKFGPAPAGGIITCWSQERVRAILPRSWVSVRRSLSCSNASAIRRAYP